MQYTEEITNLDWVKRQEKLNEITYTYSDMLIAFIAGQKFQRECVDNDNDTSDFTTWIRESYGERTR